jgi:hypothetical protein
MIKLAYLLKEIGDTLLTPYTYTRKTTKSRHLVDSFKSVFNWVTENNVKYVAFIDKSKNEDNKSWRYTADFGIGTANNPNFNVSSKDTKTGNIFRIMATMTDIIKKEIDIDAKENRSIKYIDISPTGESKAKDNRRLHLYSEYIKKNMPPGSKITITGRKIKITLPKTPNNQPS